MVVACRSSGGSATKPVEVRASTTATQQQQSSERAPAAPSQAPPALRLGLSHDTRAGLAVSLQNRAARSVTLAGALTLEVARSETFEAVAAPIELQQTCGAAPPTCVTLAPGAELLAAPVRSLEPGGQCGCTACAPLPAGRYRVVARGCDGAFSLPSAAYEIR
jgi:hypothetical protein